MKHFVFLMTIIASLMMWSCTTDSLDQENKLMETNDEQLKAIDADGKATYFANPSQEIRVEYATIDEINQAFVDAGYEPYYKDLSDREVETRNRFCSGGGTVPDDGNFPSCRECVRLLFWLDVNGNGTVSTSDMVSLVRIIDGDPVSFTIRMKGGLQVGISPSCYTAFRNGVSCEDFDVIGGLLLGLYACN